MATSTLTLVTGERYEVEGTPREVEARVQDAARGAMLQLVWLTEAGTNRPLALNPEHIVALTSDDDSP